MGATRFNTAVCDAPLTRQVIEKKRFPLYSSAMDKQRREMQNLRDFHRNIISFKFKHQTCIEKHEALNSEVLM